MIVAIDIDGPLANLHKEWYARYNQEYEDTLSVERVTDWALHKFVKPVCGLKIYDYLLDPTLYDDVEVEEGAKEAVELLKQKGNRVIFVSSAPAGSCDPKYRWMIREGFLSSKQRSHEDLVFAYDKSLIRAAILIDDGPHNLEAFQGLSIAFDTPYNQVVKKPRIYRMKGWKDLPELWEKIYG